MPKVLEKTIINEVSYIKLQNGDVSERFIIPTNIPKDYIDAIDVTSLSDTERDEIQKAYLDYLDYVKLFNKNMFNFSSWLEHTGKQIEIKYRRFKTDQLTVI